MNQAAPDPVLARPSSTRPGLGARLRRNTEWLITKPRWVVASLAVLGLLVRHAWITTRPLTAGDWHWPSPSRISAWSPWPTVWDPTLGFSGENRFLDVFRFPINAIDGAIARLGASWTFIEKVVYFLPFAALLPVAGWLLAREILGATRWAMLAPALLLANTYLLINGNGEVPLTLGEAVGCLSLVAFIRAMRRLSVKWGIATGLAVAVSAACDVRSAFLTVLMIAAYLVVLAIAETGPRLLLRRVLLGAVAGATFLATQAFWLIPILTYQGNSGLPTPQAPNFNIITLGHGIAGVAAGWSGGTPAALVEAPLNPIFMVLPLLAMVPLLRRRLSPELAWLGLLAVIFAFLAKTNTAPFGAVYNWLYRNVPGFDLFREGSKFFYPIAIAYAVLVPAAMMAITESARAPRRRRRRVLHTTLAMASALLAIVICSTLLVLEQGQLGSSTTPVSMPRAFAQLSTMLSADHQPGTVLWFGSPAYQTSDGKTHRYLIASPTHSIDNLTGNAISASVNRRDLLQHFCPVTGIPYCYVNQTFPYVASTVGASYIVSPLGQEVGLLPHGTTRAWLEQRLSALFGSPTTLGTGQTALLVWHLANPQPAVSNYPAVALVQSGPWVLPSVLPALQAMDVPAAYRQTYNQTQFPAAHADLVDSISVAPRVDGGCWEPSSTSVAVMAQSSAADLPVTVRGNKATLPLLNVSSSAPGWSFYGPADLGAGSTTIATTAPASLGPCVQWSPLTVTALAAHPQPAGSVKTRSNGEQIKAPLTGAAGPWTELRRLYDSGWHFQGHKPTAVGDGLFNLYGPTAPITSAKGFKFSFSTLPWERRGQLLTGLAVALAVSGLWWFGRRERRKPTAWVSPTPLVSGVGSVLGLVGVVFVALTGLATVLAWFGVPSIAPWTALTSDPYGLDVVLGSIALGLLLLSLLVRLGGRAATRVADAVRARRLKGKGFAAAAVAASLVVASCGGSHHAANTTIGNAQRAGAPSQQVVGSSLDAARQAQAAKNPLACIADYTAALRTFPSLTSAYAGRAACYGTLDAGASVQDLNRALALSPGDPALLLDLAGAQRRVGDLRAAGRAYLQTADAPNSSAADMLAATNGLIAIGQLDTASAVVALVGQRFPTSALAQLSAFEFDNATGQDIAASNALTKAQQLATTTSDQESVLSRICTDQLKRQQYELAAGSCAQAARVQSGGSGALDNLSAALAQLGFLAPAIVAMTASIGSFEGNAGPFAQPAGVDGFGLAHLYEARGRLYLEAHDAQLAIQDFRSALNALPTGSPDFAAALKVEIRAAGQP